MEELIAGTVAAGQDNPQNAGGDSHPSQRGQEQQDADRDLQRSLAPQLLGRSMGEIMSLLNNRRRGTHVRSIRNMVGIPSPTASGRPAAGGNSSQGREEEGNSSAYTVERIRVYTPSSFVRLFLPPLGRTEVNGTTASADSSTSESSSVEAATEEDSATASSSESSPPQPVHPEASLSEAPPEMVSTGQFVRPSAEASAKSSSGTVECSEAESTAASKAACVSAATTTTAAAAAAVAATLKSTVRAERDSLSASQRQQEGLREGGSGGGQSKPAQSAACITDSTESGDGSVKVTGLFPAACQSVSAPLNCERTARSSPPEPDWSTVEARLSTADGNVSLSGFPSKAMGLDASVHSSLTSSCGLQKKSDTKTLAGLVDFEVD